MNTKDKIKVMQAFLDGEKIQVKHYDTDDWKDIECADVYMLWDWRNNDYRIKPLEKYRPYKDTDEMVKDFTCRVNSIYTDMFMPSIWIKNKRTGRKSLITDFIIESPNVCCCGLWQSLDTLLKDYTYLDGSPIGMKVE